MVSINILSLGAETAFRGVVELRYGGVDNEVQQFHATQYEPLDRQ